MRHPDEGTIHAWLDGALSEADSAAIEAHVRACATCAEVTAEARGLIAAASRILGQLDDVSAGVRPAPTVRRTTPWFRRAPLQAAAAVLIAAFGMTIVMRDRGAKRMIQREASGHVIAATADSAATAGAIMSTAQPKTGVASGNTSNAASSVAPPGTPQPGGQRPVTRSVPPSTGAADRFEARSAEGGNASGAQRAAAPMAVQGAVAPMMAAQQVISEPTGMNAAAPAERANAMSRISEDHSSGVLLKKHHCTEAKVVTYAVRPGVEAILVSGDSASVASAPCIAAGTPLDTGALADVAANDVPPDMRSGAKKGVPVRKAVPPLPAVRTLQWTDTVTKQVYVLRGRVSEKDLQSLRRQIEH